MKDCAIGILFTEPRKRELLLVQRLDTPVWVLPGGGIDQGETPEESCIREVYEETGLKVQITRKVGLFEPMNRWTSTVHVFECEVRGGTLTPGPEERYVGFFPIDRLPRPLFHFHRDWLSEALAEHKEPLHTSMSRFTFWRMIAYFLLHPIWSFRYLCTRYRTHNQIELD